MRGRQAQYENQPGSEATVPSTHRLLEQSPCTASRLLRHSAENSVAQEAGSAGGTRKEGLREDRSEQTDWPIVTRLRYEQRILPC